MSDGIACPVDDIACLTTALSEMLNNAALHATIRAAGFQTAQKYSLRNSKKMFEQAIMQIAINRGSLQASKEHLQ